MKQHKKILSTLLKLAIGIGSFAFIYIRLKDGFTQENIQELTNILSSKKSLICLVIALILIPFNWGIESYKWQIICSPIEKINFSTAMKSVYSGVCMGNLAPGRSTEFLAKIFFFKSENRPMITVLHFINGLFQFSITILFGLTALSFKIKDFNLEFNWIVYSIILGGLIMLLLLFICIKKISSILNYVSKKLNKKFVLNDFKYKFYNKTIAKLIIFSALRYMVFFLQLNLLIYILNPEAFTSSIFISIALYFLITSIIPMISIIEAAIRTAIALFVFKGVAINQSHLALSIIMLWLLNIVLPSIVGYIILVKQDFNFKLTTLKK